MREGRSSDIAGFFKPLEVPRHLLPPSRNMPATFALRKNIIRRMHDLRGGCCTPPMLSTRSPWIIDYMPKSAFHPRVALSE